ncbi:MAG: hypothetical protein KIT33_12570 [Candidatus Kapabacteria bacterium]|nr:hypothetical protein [Ignavibacteriota bacterium]MCW5885794.1 hypothetical protein [Candidatus Kapabacteria bacterium]
MDENYSEPIVIEYEGRKFIYKYKNLSILQAELAREAGEFKRDQLEAQPESFKQVLKSRGAHWLPQICSYLFREFKDESLLKFNLDKVETDIEQYFQNLPNEERPKLEESIKDFFTNIGFPQTALLLLQRERKPNLTKTLLPLLQTVLQKNVENNNS